MYRGAHGVIAAPLNVLPALREDPGVSVRRPIPPRFLRHADEQTVVGLAAVLRAMDEGALRETCFDEWGVVAAPMFPGRLGGAATFRRYQQGGTAAISPHIIPQNSLHSVSSAISISLTMRGPNFGIGGGPEALGEGLTVAMTLLDSTALPGLWLVLTQWAPEPVPDGQGSTRTETICLAVALALFRRAEQGSGGMTLRLTASAGPGAAGRKIRVVSEAADSSVGARIECRLRGPERPSAVGRIGSVAGRGNWRAIGTVVVRLALGRPSRIGRFELSTANKGGLSMTQRVWITGVGAATPLGGNFATFAENLLGGKSGVAAHPLLPQDPGQRQFIAAVDEIPVPPAWDEADFRRYNRLEQLALSCTARRWTTPA